jgi:hypothetical protein
MKKKIALVCAVMSYSSSQSLENLSFGVLSASCGHTVSAGVAKRAKKFICDICK